MAKRAIRKKQRPALPAPSNMSDVFILLISKGLVVPFIIGCIILFAISQMQAWEVKNFTLDVLRIFKGGLLDKILAVIVLIVYFIYKYKLRIALEEIGRISAEKNKVQKKAGSKTESSELEEK